MHDPIRHTEYLRQCLRQDKSPIGFFLSAGCPLSIRVDSEGVDDRPLIPDIAGMTALVGDELQGLESYAKLATTFVEQNATPNVEDLLSRVRALSVVVGSGTVHGLSAAALAELEFRISSAVARLATVDLPDEQTPYRTLAAWAGTVSRARPVEVFTTNYDLLLEQALEDVKVPYFDGFVGSHRPFFDVAAIEHDEVPERWVRLWKLHGSVNWRREADGAVTRTTASLDGEHALIHPSHLKYDQSRRMPYLAMIDRLRAFLRQRGAALIVCGYSFNDEHLNEVLLQGLEGNPTAAAFGLMFGRLSSYGRARAIALRRSNLSLMAADAAIIGTQEAPWAQASDDDEEERREDSDNSAPFSLGDFAKLGAMLGEMIGERPQAHQADRG